MGTQQLLLIVLGVIIVGIAIAVGITIFNNQAYNSNQQAVASELNNYASMVQQWWKTPEAQGGAGQDSANLDVADIATWLGFNETGNMLTTDNGQFLVASATPGTSTTANTVVLIGAGNEERSTGTTPFPEITTTIDLDTGDITSVVGTDADGVPDVTTGS
ncbi:MAG: hypothetical protein LHW57_08150 [Candidatus Cloacimonetes bacterium]|nr:hypothetical protein [Candidatus Cloacimonadota bacterium]